MLAEDKRQAIGALFTSVYTTFVDAEQQVFANEVTQDLTLPEMNTIAAIGVGNSYPMNVIAERVGVTMGTLTTTVNHLVKKGFVQRERCSSDRRQVLVSLTSKGRTAYRIRLHFHNKLVEQATEGLTPEEQENLATAIGKVNDYLHELTAEAAEESQPQAIQQEGLAVDK